MLTPFDYINSIGYSKKNIMDSDDEEKSYSAFMVNRGLSQFQDTILFANEMNIHHHLPSKLQYDYFINTIRSRKRRSGKWAKVVENNDLSAIMDYYAINKQKASDILRILTVDQLSIIKTRLEAGGVQK